MVIQVIIQFAYAIINLQGYLNVFWNSHILDIHHVESIMICNGTRN